jgi:uncharacterized protein YgiM (DUF1202 family)
MNAKIIFSKAIVLCAVLILFSCQSKSKEEKVISRFNDLAEQIKNNGDDLEDWSLVDRMNIAKDYALILNDMQECKFTDEQIKELSKASVNVAVALGSVSNKELANEMQGLLGGVDKYLEGLTGGMGVKLGEMESVLDEITEDDDEDIDDEIEYGELPKVYSNCYDGYLNVREEPSSKSKILSTLPNGPDGAELLGVEGKWSKVRVNGVVGYIWSADVQSTPTEPVYISASDVVGTWGSAETGPLTINSNGKFSHRLGLSAIDAIVMEGTWHLTRDKIVFKYYDDGSIMTCTVNGDEMVNDDEEMVFTKG